MKVYPIDIQWHEDLPVFAREPFLRAVGNEYGWLGGFDVKNELRCILPFTIVHKPLLRIVRFRVETIPAGPELGLNEEKDFLNGAMDYLRTRGADLVMPATTNAIFRTYPDGATAAPYGSYIIDLSPEEDALWMNIDRIVRQNIKSAVRAGTEVREAPEQAESAYHMILETFTRSGLPFMSLTDFKRYLAGLGEYGRVLVAETAGVAQSFAVFGFSRHAAYAIYAGNAADQQKGANKLLYWEAIRLFRRLGARQYDFVGARIEPEPGSKQEALALFKQRFGSTLKQGFMWKAPLRRFKFGLYGLAARFRSGGDIVDAERHRRPLPSPPKA